MPAENAEAMSDEVLFECFPDVRIDHDNKAHYRARLEGRYLVNRCRACSTWHEPPRSMCPQCWSEEVVPTEISGRGTVHLITLLHQGPEVRGMDYERPWPAVAIELVEQPGLRVEATVVGCPLDDIKIGLPVQLGWIELDGQPHPAFRPVDPTEVG